MKARARLRLWIKENDETQAGLARRLRVSRQMVHHILSGYSQPGRALSGRIKTVCGIEVDAWLTDDEKKLAS